MGPASLVLALVGAPLGVTTNVAAGARAEVAAGSAPILPTEPSQATVAMELVPVAAATFEERRFRILMRYDPRLFLREPNALGLDRPVLLHRALLEDRLILDRRTTFRATIRGSLGEVDYVGLAGVVAPTQLSQVNLSVINLYDFENTLALDVRTSRRTSLRLTGNFGNGGPLDSGQSPIPRTTRIGGGPMVAYRLTRADDLRVPFTIQYQSIRSTSTAEIAAESGAVEWEHRSRQTATTVSGGVLTAESPEGFTVIPLGGAGVVTRLVDGLEARASLEHRGVLNLLRAEYRPFATATASLTLSLPPHWVAMARASFSTSTAGSPLPTHDPETFVSFDTPVVYAVDENWALEFGTRALFRAPHFAEKFETQQVQLWGYVAISGVFGTADSPRDTTSYEPFTNVRWRPTHQPGAEATPAR